MHVPTIARLALLAAAASLVSAAPVRDQPRHALIDQSSASPNDEIRTPPFVDWDDVNRDEDDGMIHTPPFRPVEPGEGRHGRRPARIATVNDDWDHVPSGANGDGDDGMIRTPPFRPEQPGRRRGSTAVATLPDGGVLHLLRMTTGSGWDQLVPVVDRGDGRVLPVTEGDDGAVHYEPIRGLSLKVQDGQVHILPVKPAKEGDELHILPIKPAASDDDELHILPIKPSKADDAGEVHILPIKPAKSDGGLHILPIKPSSSDDELHIFPIPPSAVALLIRDDSDNDVHILPIKPSHLLSDDNKLHILPIDLGDGEEVVGVVNYMEAEVHILPIKKGKKGLGEGEVHILPIGKGKKGKGGRKSRD
ncbi:hypothetical protein HK101_005100 [Irineochytrium annulatum]|nr:hypothetical protein HK101_005100 [Irineochytrium annulatum]